MPSRGGLLLRMGTGWWGKQEAKQGKVTQGYYQVSQNEACLVYACRVDIQLSSLLKLQTWLMQKECIYCNTTEAFNRYNSCCWWSTLISFSGMLNQPYCEDRLLKAHSFLFWRIVLSQCFLTLVCIRISWRAL